MGGCVCVRAFERPTPVILAGLVRFPFACFFACVATRRGFFNADLFHVPQMLLQSAASSPNLSALTQHGTKPATKTTPSLTKPTNQKPPHLDVKPTEPPLTPITVEPTIQPTYLLDGSDPTAPTAPAPAPQTAMVTQAPTPVLTRAPSVPTASPLPAPEPFYVVPRVSCPTPAPPTSGPRHDFDDIMRILLCTVLAVVTIATCVARMRWKRYYKGANHIGPFLLPRAHVGLHSTEHPPTELKDRVTFACISGECVICCCLGLPFTIAAVITENVTLDVFAMFFWSPWLGLVFTKQER